MRPQENNLKPFTYCVLPNVIGIGVLKVHEDRRVRRRRTVFIILHTPSLLLPGQPLHPS
jgi:hypothetical protein